MPPKRRGADGIIVAVDDRSLSGPAPAADADLDVERRERIARNAAALAAIGVVGANKGFQHALAEERKRTNAEASTAQIPGDKKPRARAPPRPVEPVRRSHRIAGAPAPPLAELDDDGNPVRNAGGEGLDHDAGAGLLDLLGNGAARVNAAVKPEELTEEQRAALNARRCTSKSRGSVYDSALGLTCHFCRQKKLCGEDGCPRCSTRTASASCVGKTDCSRCHSAFGIFCRACLLVRYGQETEAVRADPTWLCPHCYEEEHGSWQEHGWFCNSSICMRRQGRLPTGIAIHKAREHGYTSVAHMLQATVLAMRKDGGSKAAPGKRAGSKAAPGKEGGEGDQEQPKGDAEGPGGEEGGHVAREDGPQWRPRRWRLGEV